MSDLAGTGALVRLILRRDRILLPIWIVLLALVVVGTAASFAQLYPTAESRQPLAAAVVANPALSAFLGPLYDTSIGGLTAWRIGAFMSVLLGLISSIVVIRHTRTEEETGRRELLGATVVGRQAGLAAAVIVALAANLACAAVVAAGLTGLGLPFAGSIALGLALAAAGSTFTAIAALAAQLTVGARAARGIAILALGIAFLLRFLGDASGQNGSLAWLVWVSPIGWAQRARPLAGEQWWVFGLFLAAVAALCLAAFALSARRDMGAGVLPARRGRAAASPALRGPLALAWRLQKGGLIGWTAGFTGGGFMLGSVATSIGDFMNSSPQMKELISRLLGDGGLIDTFLSEMMSIAALVAAAFAIQAVLRLRAEEEGQRAELVLATAIGRLRWAVSHLTLAVIGPGIVLAAIGAAAGFAHGLSSGEVARYVPRGLAAAMVQLPAVWLVAGIAVALFGLLPRLAGAVWALLVAFLLLGQLGQILQLSQWILDLSPFTHVPKVLLGQAAAPPLLGLSAIAAALAFLGLMGFHRRDVGRV